MYDAENRLTWLSDGYLFMDGFESNGMSAWSSSQTDNGDLSVSATAALSGTYGLKANVNDGNEIDVGETISLTLKHYVLRFMFDPNSQTMAASDRYTIFQGVNSSGTAVLELEHSYSNGMHRYDVRMRRDTGAWYTSGDNGASDAPHTYQIEWTAATSAGAKSAAIVCSGGGRAVTTTVTANVVAASGLASGR